MKKMMILSCVGLAASASLAQTPAKVMFSNITGDPTAAVPGLAGVEFRAGIGTQFDRPYGSSRGAWWAITAFNTTGTTSDEMLIIGDSFSGASAQLVARRGDATPFDPTRVWGTFEQRVGINDLGSAVFTNNLDGAVTTDDELVARYDVTTFNGVIAREGRAANQLPGVNYGGDLNSANITNAGVVGFQAQLVGTGIITTGSNPPQNNFLDYIGDTIVARKGSTPTGSTQPWDFLDGGAFMVNDDGTSWSQTGSDLDATTIDQIAVVNNTVVLREGTIPAGSGLNTNIAASGIDELFLSNDGSWIASGNCTNADEDWVIYNGAAVAKGLEDITPNNPNGPSGELFDDATFTDLFFSVAANACGDYMVGGVTNAANVLANAVVVLNGSKVVAREGDAIDVDGDGVADNWFIRVFNNHDAFLTDLGEYVFFADIRADNTVAAGTNQAMLVIQAFCPADMNRDTIVDFNDYLEFLNKFNTGSRCVDFNRDGQTDFNDYLEFLNRFNSGC